MIFDSSILPRSSPGGDVEAQPLPTLPVRAHSTLNVRTLMQTAEERLKPVNPATAAAIRSAIKSTDVDGNGRIDSEELMDTLIAVGEQMEATNKENLDLTKQVRLLGKLLVVIAISFGVGMTVLGVALANNMKNTVESSKELLISPTGQMQAVGSNNLVSTNAQAHVVPLPPLKEDNSGGFFTCIGVEDAANLVTFKEAGSGVSLVFSNEDQTEVEVTELRGGVFKVDADGVQLGDFRIDFNDTACAPLDASRRSLMEHKTYNKDMFHGALANSRDGGGRVLELSCGSRACLDHKLAMRGIM